MRSRLSTICLAVMLAAASCFPAFAADPPPGKKPPAAAEQPEKKAVFPELPAESVTSHTIRLDGQELAYTATAGSLTLRNGKGDKSAEVFYVAYTKSGAEPASRPLTFVFNGGPGAGSAFLHVGALGPRVLDFGDGTALPFTDGKPIDNPDTWLDFTDLVFIDPVGTGYSRSLVDDNEAKREFWGVRQDLDSLGAIIHRVLSHLDRFGSSIYLVGESYGGFRAARLPVRLADKEGIPVHGVVLVSPIIEFGLARGSVFNPMSWALRLPSYAAVHLEAQGKLTPEALADVERYALGDYVAALVTPPKDPAQQDQLYARIADYTGLDPAMVRRWHGRVPLGLFVKEIHHDQEKLASRYDGSVLGGDPRPAAYFPQSADPILLGLKAPLTNGFVTYLRDELHYKTDRRYELLSDEIEKKWEWRDRPRGGPVGAASDLAEGLAMDPRLKVLIAHGMTDLQTPYLASRYVVDHMPDALTRDRVTLKLYAGGHMMYLRPASRARLHEDARSLYSGTPK
jgi:carboxypeptidase C (cathepsin A)